MPVVLGFGFYIIYKGGVRCRVLGFAGLLLFSLMFPIARTMLTMNFQQVSIAPIGFVLTNPVIWRNIGFEFLRCFLLAVVAIGGGTLLREKSKFSVIALIGAVIVLITGLSVSWMHLRMAFMELTYTGQVSQMFISQLGNAIFFQLVNAGFFMLAAILAHMFTERNIERMRLSGGARAWCILVYCATGISLIFAIVTGDIPTIFQAILGIPTVIGMIILSTGRRFGFSLALLGVGITVMLSFAQMFPFRPSVVATNIGYVVGGCINPLITWAAISRAWRRSPPPEAEQSATQAGGSRQPLPYTTAMVGVWSRSANGGSVYYSQNADSLYAAGEILKVLTAIPPQTYYMVETPEGTLSRDANGFFTEASGKTSNPEIQKP